MRFLIPVQASTSFAGACLASEGGLESLPDIAASHPLNGRNAHIQGVPDGFIGPAILPVGAIRLEQNARMGQGLGRGLALLREVQQQSALFGLQPHDIFLGHGALLGSPPSGRRA